GTVPIVSDQELLQMQVMLDSGITPAPERIKEWLLEENRDSPQKAGTVPIFQKIKAVRDVLRDALRIEEGRSAKESNPQFKELLIVVESNKSPQELTLALARITP
ncbi:MAG: hypothetical protein V1650_01025, partial [Candidatus Omnitrophota bacterium]